jgi:alpha-tubulin suppressor-like RCC1 family protein
MTPHPLAGLSAIAITAGYSHTCAIAAGGGVKCWGYNWDDQLGVGNFESQSRPADVTGAARQQQRRGNGMRAIDMKSLRGDGERSNESERVERCGRRNRDIWRQRGGERGNRWICGRRG